MRKSDGETSVDLWYGGALPETGNDCSPASQAMTDQQVLKEKLAALRVEHRDLDDVIARLGAQFPVDQLQLQRLKKRKLLLKDMIARIESELLPDIIA